MSLIECFCIAGHEVANTCMVVVSICQPSAEQADLWKHVGLVTMAISPLRSADVVYT